jgi:Mor family transcriptional regulator
MSYIRAEKILPMEIVKLIQKYVDGENIYIPKKEGTRQEWGKNTRIRQELKERNEYIYFDYMRDQSVSALAQKYYLSEKSIQRILHMMKKK